MTTAKTQSQLERLAQPFPQNSMKTKPDSSRAAYVPHGVVTQKALEVVGPYTLEIGGLIRGLAPEVPGKNGKPGFPAVQNAVTGALVTIKATIDGQEIAITEVGECENPAVRKTDGERAKMAISDGIKRCWMRVGLGLHLWSGDDYTLADAIAEPAAPEPPAADAWKQLDTREKAIAFGASIFDADGVALFEHSKAAMNSFDKLMRDYVASLPPVERPTKDSTPAQKAVALETVAQLWVQKLTAKWHGQTWENPTPWSESVDDAPEPPAEEQATPAPAAANEARETVTV